MLFALLLTAQSAVDDKLRAGLSALQSNNLAVAQSNFEDATRLAPSNGNAWFLLAQTYARRGDKNSALRAARMAAGAAGRDSTLLYNLALFFRDGSDSDQAIALGKRAIAVENSAETQSLVGQIYAERKDWPNAILHFREAARLAPNAEEPVFRLAQAHLQNRDFTSAISVLERGHKNFAQSPQLELALGVAYYGERRFVDAVNSYLRVMELSPDTPQPYYFLGRILEHARDRLPLVIERATYFETHHASSPLGYLLHAKALILQLPAAGYPPEAQQAQALLQSALKLDDNMAETHYLMGTLLDRQQDYAAAAAQLERSIALNERDPAPHFRLARVYDKLGRKDAAAEQRTLHEKLSEGPDR